MLTMWLTSSVSSKNNLTVYTHFVASETWVSERLGADVDDAMRQENNSEVITCSQREQLQLADYIN